MSLECPSCSSSLVPLSGPQDPQGHRLELGRGEEERRDTGPLSQRSLGESQGRGGGGKHRRSELPRPPTLSGGGACPQGTPAFAKQLALLLARQRSYSRCCGPATMHNLENSDLEPKEVRPALKTHFRRNEGFTLSMIH